MQLVDARMQPPARGGRLQLIDPRASSGVMRRTATRRLSAFGPQGRDLQELLAVALRDEVLRRHAERLGEDDRHLLGAPIRQGEVVDVGADRVRVAFDEEHLVRAPVEHAVDRVGDAFQTAVLIVGHLPGAEVEVDRIEVDAAHAVAQVGVVADLLERVAAVESLDRAVHQCIVDVRIGRPLVVDDVALARHAQHRRPQVERSPDRAPRKRRLSMRFVSRPSRPRR